jgi:hypothetical protein
MNNDSPPLEGLGVVSPLLWRGRGGSNNEKHNLPYRTPALIRHPTTPPSGVGGLLGLAGHYPRVAEYYPRVAEYKPRVAEYKPRVAEYKPRVAACKPPLAYNHPPALTIRRYAGKSAR